VNIPTDESGRYPQDGVFSANAAWFASNYGQVVRIHRLADGAITATLNQFSQPVLAISLSPDGAQLATVENSNVKIWNTTDGALLKNYPLPGLGSHVNFISFSPDGKSVVLFSDSLRRWQLDSDQLQETRLEGYSSGYRGAFSFTADGQGLMVALLDGSLHTYKLPQGAQNPAVNLPGMQAKAMAISADRVHMASVLGSRVQVWQTSNGQQTADLEGQRNLMAGVAFSPDGKFVAAPGADKTIIVWRLEDQSILLMIPTPAVVWSVSYSPDGSMLAAYSNGTIFMFQTSDGKLRYQVNGYAAAFSPDGQTLAAAWGIYDSSKITLYNSADGKPHGEFQADGGTLAFSPDNKVLAIAGSQLSLRQVSDGKQLSSLDNPAPYGLLAFSPDGKLISEAGWDGRVYIWGIK
jgi:WD40 repeat protein